MAKPTDTVDVLVSSGITHVVGLPDNTSGPLFDALVRHSIVRLVTVTREGEAPAIATGLWMGGAFPLVVIQNTGLLECGDSLRGTAIRVAAPIPFLVTGRGYARLAQAGVDRSGPPSLDLLTRADVDSAALLTEPTLDAWGIPHRTCSEEDDPADALRATIVEAREAKRPVALIVARTLG